MNTANLTTLVLPELENLTTCITGFFYNLKRGGNSGTITVTMPILADLSAITSEFMSNAFYRSGNVVVSLPELLMVTNPGANFMVGTFATSRTQNLSIPAYNTFTTVGNFFMSTLANNCDFLTSITLPILSDVTTIGTSFFRAIFGACSLGSNTIVMPALDDVSYVSSEFLYGAFESSLSGSATITLPTLAAAGAVSSAYMQRIFNSCGDLTAIPTLPILGGVTAVGVSFLEWSFRGTVSLTTVDLSYIDLSEVTEIGIINQTNNFMAGSFIGSGLTSIELFQLGTSDGVLINNNNFMSGTFTNCTSLASATVGDILLTTRTGANFMLEIFSGCSSLSSIVFDVKWKSTSGEIGNAFMARAFQSTALTSPLPWLDIVDSDVTVGQDFAWGLYLNSTITSPIEEPIFGAGKVNFTGFMTQTYYGTKLTGTFDILNRNGGAIFSANPFHATTERASQKTFGNISTTYTIRHTDGSPVTVPGDGTSAEGIASNFYAS